jgi:Rrf2 family transcriptional regulator, iron-sulfur cluster assembly transcription factor
LYQFTEAMKINTKIRYGLRTMLEIAKAPDNEGILQKDIAKNQNISLKYLDSIISSLKLKGLIHNSKGRGSGYALTRSPKEITMFDIYTAFEKIEVIECINNRSYCERSTHDCQARSFWTEFSRDYVLLLQNKSLEDIMNITYYECKCF